MVFRCARTRTSPMTKTLADSFHTTAFRFFCELPALLTELWSPSGSLLIDTDRDLTWAPLFSTSYKASFTFRTCGLQKPPLCVQRHQQCPKHSASSFLHLPRAAYVDLRDLTVKRPSRPGKYSSEFSSGAPILNCCCRSIAANNLLCFARSCTRWLLANPCSLFPDFIPERHTALRLPPTCLPSS